MYIKYDQQLQDQLSNIYSIIWGQVIDELCATIKSISGFSVVADKFYSIGLLNLIQKAMLNVQSRKYFPTVVHTIKMSFYYMVQEKGSTVQ